jgi:hypothetical protein
MIDSWEAFMRAVETMRSYQIEYFRLKEPSALIKAKKYEALVDACIEERKLRLAAKKRPELLEAGNE